MPQLLLTLVLIAVGWALLIRPQQQRIRQQRELVASLVVGDRVVTAGGIHGTVVALDDETVRLDVAPATVLTVARPAISHRVADDQPVVAAPGEDEHPARDEAGVPAEDHDRHDAGGPS